MPVLNKRRGPAKHTRCEVTFFTDEEDGFNGTVSFDGTDTIAQSVFGRIVAVSTKKSFGGPGTFSITVKKPTAWRKTAELGRRVGSWHRLWKDPEDTWVLITFFVDGTPVQTMLGLIDSIAEDHSISPNGARSETYTISGRDHGKVLETTPLFFIFYDNGAALEAQFEGYVNAMQAIFTKEATPEEIVVGLLDIFSSGQRSNPERPWMLPSGLARRWRNFWQLLQLRTQRMTRERDGYIIDEQPLLPQENRMLWSTMQEYCNPLMNELWTDLALDLAGSSNWRPTLFLRRRPFPTQSDYRAWDALPTHRLSQSSVVSRQVAKGNAAARYNYWHVQIEGLESDSFDLAKTMAEANDGTGAANGEPGSMPIFDLNSIARHGLRRFQQSTRFIPYFEDSDARGHFLRLWAQWTKTVHDWYVTAPYELSGTLQLASLWPEIRIGERVREEVVDGAVIYYVEEVEHSYQYPGVAKTRLGVTRGQYEGEYLLDYVYRQRAVPRPTVSEQCFIDSESDDTLINSLARGCVWGTVQDDQQSGLSAEFTLEAGDVSDERYQEALQASPAEGGEVIRDEQPLGAEVPSMDGPETRDPTDFRPPEVAEESRSLDNPLPQDRLERGQPIEFDFDENDPLAGLEDESSEIPGP